MILNIFYVCKAFSVLALLSIHCIQSSGSILLDLVLNISKKTNNNVANNISRNVLSGS